jgi:hypothetical protein
MNLGITQDVFELEKAISIELTSGKWREEQHLRACYLCGVACRSAFVRGDYQGSR